MAKTIESQEIGAFKNPEELAQALENNSKTEIAGKIRKISSAVKDTSIDLRKKLQDELTDQEQIEIRATLKGSGVGKVFTKGMTPEEIKNNIGRDAVVGVVGAEGADMIEKGEGYIKSLSDAWETAGKLFEEGKYMAAIGVFLKGLFGGFSLKEWNKSDEKKEDGKDGEKKGEEKGKSTLYIAGTKLLLGFSKHKTDISYSILQNKEIKTLTYEQLSIDNLEKDGLGKKYGLPGKDNEVFNTLSILKERQDFIDKTLGKKFPNWKKELTLEKLVLEYGKYGNSFDKIRGISLSDLKSLKLPDDLFSFNKDNNGTLDEILNERLQDESSKLKGVDKGFLITLYSSKESKFDKDLLNGYPNSNTDFISDYIEFRNKIPAFISGNFFHGNSSAKEKFSQYFNNFSFTHKDILDLYIITNGDLNFEKLNDFQNGLIFLKVFDLLGKDNSGLRGETYLFAIREVIEGKSNEITNKIPQSVRETFLNIAKETGETVMEGAVGFLKDLWGALSIEQKAGTVAASILYIVGMIYLGRAIFAGKALGIGFLGGIGILSTQKIYEYLSSDTKTKAVLDKYKIKNGDDLGNEFNKINP